MTGKGRPSSRHAVVTGNISCRDKCVRTEDASWKSCDDELGACTRVNIKSSAVCAKGDLHRFSRSSKSCKERGISHALALFTGAQALESASGPLLSLQSLLSSSDRQAAVTPACKVSQAVAPVSSSDAHREAASSCAMRDQRSVLLHPTIALKRPSDLSPREPASLSRGPPTPPPDPRVPQRRVWQSI